MSNVNNISTSFADTTRLSGGIGSVSLPPKEYISREEYIYDCYKNGWVSIYIEGEGLKERVNCDINSFNWIYFPEEEGKLGSTVVWVSDPIKGLIYIVAVLSGGTHYESATEDSFRFIRRVDKNFVEITGNPKEKYLNLVLHSDRDSTLNINVTDDKKTSKLNIFVNGELKVKTNTSIDFLTHEEFRVTVEDEDNSDYRSRLLIKDRMIQQESYSELHSIWERFLLKVSNRGQTSRKKNSIIDVVPEKISMRTNRFEINTGKEKMVLGDSLIKFLEELIIEISESEVSTPMGLIPLYNKRKIASFTLKLRKLLSRHGFLS